MNIGDRLIERLDLLSTKGPDRAKAVIMEGVQPQHYIIGVEEDKSGLSISVSMRDYDRYSVTLCRLEVSYLPPAPVKAEAVGDYLRDRTEMMVKRLTYLVEPLKVIELDPVAGAAQLRSNPAASNTDEKSYWEAILRLDQHHRIKMSRYQWKPDSTERELVPYPSIFANLGRMAEDLAGILAEE